MYIFMLVLIGIIALLLVVVVLLQSGKGGGLAGIAAGGQATQILGARQAPDFLEKASWTLGAAFIVLCIMVNFLTGPDEVTRSIIQERGVQELPAGPGAVPPGVVPEGPNTAPMVPPPATEPTAPVQ
jgi:preprotein translocase subunit SecG